VQSKVIDGRLAENMQFWAAMGHPVGPPFKAEAWLKDRPEFSWMRGLLKDLDAHPWSKFSTDMK
jgi:hypothetical protein